jgi:NarL family two-component system sensor histidine kinase YdfH
VLVLSVLLWLNLSGAARGRAQWLAFALQGAVVFAVGLLVPQGNVVLSLYLALTLAVTSVSASMRAAVSAVTAYIALFVAGVLWSPGMQPNWNVFWTIFWFKSDYAALILFSAGYLLLYRQQRRARDQLEVANARLEASARQIEELTLVNERHRLARELHDTLAQGVAGIIMRLEAASAHLKLRRLDAAQEIVAEAMVSARGTLTEARDAISGLRAVSSPDAFTNAAYGEIDRFERATGIACCSELSAASLVPTAVTEPAIRALREGLTNVTRHARARTVWVRVLADEQSIAVEVQDDGIGFDPVAVAKERGHYGLIGLQERARLVSGSLQVDSTPGAGTTMRMRFPRHAG